MKTAFYELYNELKNEVTIKASNKLIQDSIDDDEPITENKFVDTLNEIISYICENVKISLWYWFDEDIEDIQDKIKESLNSEGYEVEEEE